MIIIESVTGIRMGRCIIRNGQWEGIKGGPDDEVQAAFERHVKGTYNAVTKMPIRPWEGDVDWIIGERIVETSQVLKIGFFRPCIIDPDVEY
ncbi:hypothetical protein [Desulfocicer niacini]